MTLRFPQGAIYGIVCLILLVLTVSTTLVSYVDLGRFNVVVALLIAAIKSGLVLWFFMHLPSTGFAATTYAASSLFWLALMISLTLADVETRDWIAPVYPW